jgi:hypothetical protein
MVGQETMKYNTPIYTNLGANYLYCTSLQQFVTDDTRKIWNYRKLVL